MKKEKGFTFIDGKKIAYKNILDELYKNEILPFAILNPSVKFYECLDCVTSNYLGIKIFDKILEVGECSSCGKVKPVFNPYVAKQVILRYGMSDVEYFKIKDQLFEDINKDNPVEVEISFSMAMNHKK